MSYTGLRHIGTKEPWNGERIGGKAHAPNIGEIWTEAQLKKVGLEKVPPSPAVEPQPLRLCEPWQFIDLFTDSEYATMAEKRKTNLALDKWLTLALATSSINLDSPRVQGGMTALVAEGVLTQARADIIMSTDFAMVTD